MHAETLTPIALTTLKLRPAVSHDLAFIRECAKRWGLDDSNLKPEQFLIAAAPGGPTLGFGRALAHKGFHEIATLGVVPEARGTGLGRLLVEALIAGCPSDDIWAVTELTHWFAELGFRPMLKAPLELQAKLVVCASKKGHKNARFMHLRKYTA